MSKENIFDLPGYGWKPYKYQARAWRAMVDPGLRRAYLCWPRRHGKDSAAGHICAIKAMQRVGNYAIMFPLISQGRRALWEGLSHLNIPRVEEFFPPEIVVRRDTQSMMIWLASGSTVQILGSDTFESSIGSSFTGIVYSEAALTKLEASQYLRPMIEGQRPPGWEIHISTPRGVNHFKRGLDNTFDMMRKGTPGMYAEHIRASDAGLFSAADLLRIRMDYIAEMGQTLGEALYQQEYETSFEAATPGAVWLRELQEMEEEGRVKPRPYIRGNPCLSSWDLGVADSTSIAIWTRHDGQHVLIDSIESSGIGLDSYIEELRKLTREKGYQFTKHFAPSDIANREWIRGVSRLDEAKRMGLIFTRTPQTRVKTQIAAAAQLLRRTVVDSSSPGAMAMLEHWKRYRFNINKTTGTFMDQPIHDEHSHASSALMTYALNTVSDFGSGHDYIDSDFHSDANHKFDPRQFGRGTPYGHDGNVSGLMRGRRTGGTAFG